MSALPVRVLEAGAQASAATSSTAINLILKLNPDTPSPTSSPGAVALHVIKAPPASGMKKQHLELIAACEIEARGLDWQERARAKYTRETRAVHHLPPPPPPIKCTRSYASYK